MKQADIIYNLLIGETITPFTDLKGKAADYMKSYYRSFESAVKKLEDAGFTVQVRPGRYGGKWGTSAVITAVPDCKTKIVQLQDADYHRLCLPCAMAYFCVLTEKAVLGQPEIAASSGYLEATPFEAALNDENITSWCGMHAI